MGRLQKWIIDWVQVLKMIFKVIKPFLKERFIFL